MAQEKQKHIIADGLPVFYTRSGEGPALLLIHGFTETSFIWQGMSTELSERFTLIIPDLPGHGLSPSFDETHSMEALARRMAAILEAEGIAEFVVVGHSMGGYVSLALARMLGRQRVKGICLFHSHAAADSPEARETRLRTIQAVEQGHEFFIRQFIPDLFAEHNQKKHEQLIEVLKQNAAEMNTRDINASLRGMMGRENMLDFLIDSGIPVLFIAGALDKRIPYSSVIEQAQALPVAELILMKDAAHMGWAEETAVCLKGIMYFSMKNL